jgi:hypothetical protein
MPDFGILRGFNEKLFGDKLFAGQTPTKLGVIGSDDSSYTNEYRAILQYAQLNGFTIPTKTQQNLQNNLIVSLMSSGIWSKFD